ncbi:MAG: BBP7 family outer membrane beta-barrel protein, partial [bacterium]|nr:BBP7 family outer membrane beta-barrel protein [bacterium]
VSPTPRTAYWNNTPKEAAPTHANPAAQNGPMGPAANGKYEPLPTPPTGGQNQGGAGAAGQGQPMPANGPYNGNVQGGAGFGQGQQTYDHGQNYQQGQVYEQGNGYVQGNAGYGTTTGQAVSGGTVGVTAGGSSGYVVNEGEYLVGGGGGYGGGYGGGGGGFVVAGGYGGSRGVRGGACYFGGVNALGMTRDSEDDLWLSFDTSNVAGHLLSYEEAEMPYSGGIEATFGRKLGCNSAIEARYFGFYPQTVEANAYDPDGVLGSGSDLNTTLDFSPLNYDNGGGANSVDNFFDNSARHRLTRSWEIQNFEVNFLHNPCCMSSGCNSVTFLAGFRYLRFNEDFSFASDPIDTQFNGNVNEMFYDISTQNNLYGFQLGAEGRWAMTKRLDLVTAVKFGVYANDITHQSRIYGSNGTAVVGAGPNAGRTFDVRSQKTDASFIGEVDLGLSYRLGCHWALRGGYRAIAISGLALPGQQVPQFFSDIDGVADIDSGASTILHGAYAGAEFSW